MQPSCTIPEEKWNQTQNQANRSPERQPTRKRRFQGKPFLASPFEGIWPIMQVAVGKMPSRLEDWKRIQSDGPEETLVGAPPLDGEKITGKMDKGNPRATRHSRPGITENRVLRHMGCHGSACDCRPTDLRVWSGGPDSILHSIDCCVSACLASTSTRAPAPVILPAGGM